MQFTRAVQALCDEGVEFVVIGGLAATFHGSARITFDLDICYCRSSSNLRRLTAALAPFHPRPREFPAGVPFLWDDATLRNATTLTLQTEIGEIDLLAEVTGLGTYEEVKACSVTVDAWPGKRSVSPPRTRKPSRRWRAIALRLTPKYLSPLRQTHRSTGNPGRHSDRSASYDRCPADSESSHADRESKPGSPQP